MTRITIYTILPLVIYAIGIPACASFNLFSIQPRETNSCEERGTPGLICQNCELMATCVKINNIWLTVPVETCDKEQGYYCNLNENGCSNRTGPCHPYGFEGNFACTSEGVFPDPYDCQKYHMCYRAGSSLVAANIDCGSKKAFSVNTGDCSLNLSHQACQSRQYVCNTAGDSHAWPGNSNIFYICKATVDNDTRILYPTLYRCASGETYDGIDCIPNYWNNATNENGSYLDDPTVPTIEHKCADGSNGLYPDPRNCHAYYHCVPNRTTKHYICPENTHFSKKSRSCVFGKC